MPALLVWGFWLASSAGRAARLSALAAWTKFAALLVAPLWPDLSGRLGVRPGAVRAAFAGATLAAFCDPPARAPTRPRARVFWDRTFGSQFDRHSPFSLWDWGPVPRARASRTSTSSRSCSTRCSSRRRRRVAFVPRRKSTAPARGAHGCAADRVRARADALVLPLYPVVLPFRRLALLLGCPGVPAPGRLPRASRPARSAAALCLVSWRALLHTSGTATSSIIDVPVYEGYGDAIEPGAVALSRLQARVSARRAARVRAARRSLATTRGLRATSSSRLMAACGVARVLFAALRALAGLRRSRRGRRRARARRRLAAPARLRRADALRPLPGRRSPSARSPRSSPAATASGRACSAPPSRSSSIPRCSCRSRLPYLAPARAARGACLPRRRAARRRWSFSRSWSWHRGVARSIGRQLSRPLQIESLGAAVLFAATTWSGCT